MNGFTGLAIKMIMCSKDRLDAWKPYAKLKNDWNKMHRTDKFVALIKCRNQLHIWKSIEIMSKPYEIETSKGRGNRDSKFQLNQTLRLWTCFRIEHIEIFSSFFFILVTSTTLSSVVSLSILSFPLEKETSRYDQVHASVCILITT